MTPRIPNTANQVSIIGPKKAPTPNSASVNGRVSRIADGGRIQKPQLFKRGRFKEHGINHRIANKGAQRDPEQPPPQRPQQAEGLIQIRGINKKTEAENDRNRDDNPKYFQRPSALNH